MMGPAMMRMMLTLMDTDGHGTVSLSEFQAAHERMFKAMDGDKDGRLTLRDGCKELGQPLLDPGPPYPRSCRLAGYTGPTSLSLRTP